jgi:hypothetical protein
MIQPTKGEIESHDDTLDDATEEAGDLTKLSTTLKLKE